MEDLATGVYSLPLLMVLQEHKAELMPYLAKRADDCCRYGSCQTTRLKIRRRH